MNLLEFLKPTNNEAEQEKFFSSTTYNPQFTYNWDKVQIDEWLSATSQKKYIPLVHAILDQDHDHIVQEAKKIFATDIEQSLLEEARKIILKPRLELQKQSIDDLVELYKSAFQYFGIPYTVILSDERGFAARPSHSNKTLVINKRLSLKYDSCAGLTRHELVHIIRAINSEGNGIEKSDQYLPTEEGMACYLQNYRGSEENYSIYQHASRYVVTKIALEGSFRDIVEYLQENGFEKTLAYRRAVRHKLGFVDTAKPGDIMKSSMYFYNLNKVKQLSNLEILRLFTGKIAIEDLHTYPTYEGKIEVEKIKKYFSL